MNHPPIPPNSRYFRHKFWRDDEFLVVEMEEDWCPIGEASDWEPYWRTIIAAVAAEEWNRRAEAQIEDAFLSLTALHNREEWREWGRAKP